jgi:Fe-S oxidoreductase
MLDRARRRWREILDALAPDIRAGTPIIGLEPACVSAFRDELPSLFPDVEDATRLAKQTFFFSEFISQHCADRKLPTMPSPALVQIHCHQHAVLDPQSEENVLGALQLKHDILKSGCCGMAGSFGFEQNKFAVSMAAAERVLLPEIRKALPSTLILANGFSCREQIEQTTGRRTLHIAEVISQALSDASQ